MGGTMPVTSAAIVLFIALLLLPLPSRAGQGDYVVLLHGIGRTNGSMEKMEDALVRQGYAVINIDYASRQKPFEELVLDVRKAIEQAHVPVMKKLDFVGHSMGGLIIRAYIHKYKPKNLGRVVMLGTPNQGSEVADLLKDNFLYKAYYGPAGQELTTRRDSLKKVLGAVDYDLGVIAGDRSVDPVSSLLIIPGDDDGKVSVTRTRIKGMKDHVVLHATHTFMPSNDEVIRQTEYFLERGKFLHKTN